MANVKFLNNTSISAALTVATTGTFGGHVTLSSDSSSFINLANTTSLTGKTWRFSSAPNGKLFITQDGVVDAVTLEHTTGNATFAGTITATLGTFSSTTDQILILNSTDSNAVYMAYQRAGTRIGFTGFGGNNNVMNFNNETST